LIAFLDAIDRRERIATEEAASGHVERDVRARCVESASTPEVEDEFVDLRPAECIEIRNNQSRIAEHRDAGARHVVESEGLVLTRRLNAGSSRRSVVVSGRQAIGRVQLVVESCGIECELIPDRIDALSTRESAETRRDRHELARRQHVYEEDRT